MNLIAAAVVPLILNLPTLNAGTGSQCVGSTQTQDIDQVRVYRQVGSGPFRLHTTKSVVGMEGRADTIWVDPSTGASFYATVTDSWGNESCPSVALYLGPITGTESEVADPVLEVHYYDVHGRRMSDRRARGVYWETRRYLSGRIETKKLVLLR
ncbi:MAG TPA: hypothetical protein VFP58_13520 [Candidatus Eisenbacteria bacterium]|nr:hypothetical protein [Candidatus Eisenbacteria bacterium]